MRAPQSLIDAVEAWAVAQAPALSRSEAIRSILADWLIGHGFMKRDSHALELAGPATDAVEAMDAAITKDRASAKRRTR